MIDHDHADHGAAGVDGANQHRRTRVAQIVNQHGAAAGIGERLGRLADRVVFVGTHGALAQPQHIAELVMQRYGMGAGRFDGRTHLLTDGIEIDKRTVRCR